MTLQTRNVQKSFGALILEIYVIGNNKGKCYKNNTQKSISLNDFQVV